MHGSSEVLMSDGMRLVAGTGSLQVGRRRSRRIWRLRYLGCCAMSSSHRSGHMSLTVITAAGSSSETSWYSWWLHSATCPSKYQTFWVCNSVNQTFLCALRW